MTHRHKNLTCAIAASQQNAHIVSSIDNSPNQTGIWGNFSCDEAASLASAGAETGSGAGAGAGAGFGGVGAIQKTGYRRCKLFNSKAQHKSIVEDSSTTGKKYHESCQMASSVAGSKAVAPAGGCVVLVSCMTTMAIAVDNEAASQRNDSKRAWSGMRLNNLVTQRPVKALKKCPKIKARG
jgi:hypothetical protein